MKDDITSFQMFDEQPATAGQPQQVQIFMDRTEHKTVYTTSRSLAEFTGIEHKNILAAIRRLIARDTTGDTTRCFYETTYTNNQNKAMPEFYINQNGFLLLSLASKSITQECKSMIMMVYSAHNEKNRNELVRAIEENNKLKQELAAAQSSMSEDEILNKAVLIATDRINKQQAVIIKQQQTIEQKDQQIAANQTAVDFANAISNSTDCILIRQLADHISQALKNAGYKNNVGQNNLFEWMRQFGYLKKGNTRDQNLPTKKCQEMGLMEVKTTPIDHKTIPGTWNSRTPLVTAKGLEYFTLKFLNIYKEGGTVTDGPKKKNSSN